MVQPDAEFGVFKLCADRGLCLHGSRSRDGNLQSARARTCLFRRRIDNALCMRRRPRSTVFSSRFVNDSRHARSVGPISFTLFKHFKMNIVESEVDAILQSKTKTSRFSVRGLVHDFQPKYRGITGVQPSRDGVIHLEMNTRVSVHCLLFAWAPTSTTLRHEHGCAVTRICADSDDKLIPEIRVREVIRRGNVSCFRPSQHTLRGEISRLRSRQVSFDVDDVVYLKLPVQIISGLSGEFVSDVEHVAVFDFARAERKLERLAAAAKREKDVFLVRHPRHARGPGVSGEGRRDSPVVGRVESGHHARRDLTEAIGGRSFTNSSLRACGEKGSCGSRLEFTRRTLLVFAECNSLRRVLDGK